MLESTKVTQLKDEIYDSLIEQWQRGMKGVVEYDGSFEDSEVNFDVLGIADKIGNHLVVTIFKDDDEYRIIDE